MDRRDLILATLAAGGGGATFDPVQTQKLFFLIDREASHLFGGPHFNFKPYDYGPFDRLVYDEMNAMRDLGFVRIDSSGGYSDYNIYSLTSSGFEKGNKLFVTFSPSIQIFLRDTVKWIRSLTFQQLIAAIYRRYSDMKVNSIFKG